MIYGAGGSYPSGRVERMVALMESSPLAVIMKYTDP